MTLSAPPEQTLREPVGRRVKPPSRSAILYDDGGHTGVDGPLIPVLPAAVAAAS